MANENDTRREFIEGRPARARFWGPPGAVWEPIILSEGERQVWYDVRYDKRTRRCHMRGLGQYFFDAEPQLIEISPIVFAHDSWDSGAFLAWGKLVYFDTEGRLMIRDPNSTPMQAGEYVFA